MQKNLDQFDGRELPPKLKSEFANSAQCLVDRKQGRVNKNCPSNPLRTGTSNKFLVPISLQAIWGYGCWCHFGQDLMKGQGQPVNLMDSFCKSMQLCLRCAVIDGENCPDEMENESTASTNKTCNPMTQNYQTAFSRENENEAILADCAAANPDNACAKNVCCCEMKFVADLISLITSSTPFDLSYQHSRGFKYQENCVGQSPGQGNDGSERQCCGEYPARSIYNNQKLQCCAEDNSIYNPFSHDCCVNGVGVKPVGSCPNGRK